MFKSWSKRNSCGSFLILFNVFCSFLLYLHCPTGLCVFFFEIPENQLDFRNVHRGWWNDTSKRGAVIYTAPEIFEKLCFSA